MVLGKHSGVTCAYILEFVNDLDAEEIQKCVIHWNNQSKLLNVDLDASKEELLLSQRNLDKKE